MTKSRIWALQLCKDFGQSELCFFHVDNEVSDQTGQVLMLT